MKRIIHLFNIITMLIFLDNRYARHFYNGTTFLNKLWWRWMPGVTIKVQWPSDKRSADPNDHYREELEKLVGWQGWDWNWGLMDNDVTNNTLTIKIRRGKTKHVSYFLLKWG